MTSQHKAYPSMKPQIHGKPSKKWAATASAIHSVRQGENASRTTAKDNFFSAAGSKPKPARIKITVKAICLQISLYDEVKLLQANIQWYITYLIINQCLSVKQQSDPSICQIYSKVGGQCVWHRLDLNHGLLTFYVRPTTAEQMIKVN